MTFILWGAAAAAIPIVVHLLHRQKTVPIQWGAMQFLLETPLKLKRRARIDHWVLMLLRMAMLVLLAFILARPIVQGVTYSTETPIDVIVVLDHSLSMSRRVPTSAGGNSTLFESAIQSTEKLAAMLPQRAMGGGATVGIVLAEHSPKVITPLPVPLAPKTGATTWPQILQQLRELKAGTSDANIPLAIQSAGELASRGPNLRKLILVISDDQRANWQINDTSAWALSPAAKTLGGAIPVYSMPLSITATLPNVSVSGINILPGFVGVGRPAQIIAAITQNSGGSDISNLTLRLFIDNKQVETQQLARVSPGQSVTVRFTHTFTEAGSHAVAVKADFVDALDADNIAATPLVVSPKLPVLIVDGQLNTPPPNYPAAQYLLIAMDTAPAPGRSPIVNPKLISVSELASTPLENFPIVILNDIPRLPSETVRRLVDHVHQGNAAWILLGPRTQLDFLTDVLTQTPLLPAQAQSPVQIPLSAPAIPADIREPENPAFASLTAAEQNAMAGVNFRSWWRLKPTSQDLHTVLATTGASGGAGGGDPLILETTLGERGGRAIIWTSPILNSNWNNLHLAGSTLVPLVNETLFHLASGKTKLASHPLNPGEAILWTLPARPPIESATLTLPDSSNRTIQPQLRGDHYLLTDKETFSPGIYELNFQPATISQPVWFAVNIDRRELDPALVAGGDIDWLKEHRFLTDRLTLETLPNALGAQRGGFELWWPLALLLLAFLLLETLATARLAKKQTETTPETAGLVTPHK